MKRSTLVRLIKLAQSELPLYYLGLIGKALGEAGIQLAVVYLMRDMFDSIATSNQALLLSTMKTYPFYLVVGVVIMSFFAYIYGRSTILITHQLRQLLYSKFHVLPLGYYKEHHSGDTISRFTNDLVESEKAYRDYPSGIVTHVLLGIGALVLLGALDWRLGTYSLVLGVLSLLANVLFAKRLLVNSRVVQQRLSHLTELMVDLFSGLQVAKTFNLGKLLLQRFGVSSGLVYDKSLERVETSAVLNSLNHVFSTLNFLGLLALGSYLSIRGIISVGSIVAAVQLQNYVAQLFKNLGNLVTGLQTSLAAAERIFEVLDAQPEPTRFASMPCLASDAAVEFSQVDFSFSPNEHIIKDMSFTVERGRVVALVGPSGGGKSTVLKLIMGFYQPHSGTIAVAGQSLSQQDLVEARRMCSFVPQDAYLFAGTVADNILLGRPSATPEQVAEAAKLANAHDFILELDHGYDTEVGERGAQLSGGQRQRIAIARAIIHNAPILLLDEATSALDSESEQLVQEALSRLMEGRTTIVVAHRLSTIEHADRILVISGGRIVESGSHVELLDNVAGVYRRLYEQQFQRAG